MKKCDFCTVNPNLPPPSIPDRIGLRRWWDLKAQPRWRRCTSGPRTRAGSRDATAATSPSAGHSMLLLSRTACSFSLLADPTHVAQMRVAFEGTTRNAQTIEIPTVVLSSHPGVQNSVVAGADPTVGNSLAPSARSA